MDDQNSNKRLKAASGQPIKLSSSTANLPVYQPPPWKGQSSNQSSSNTRPTASVARPANSTTSLRLTVKAPPSRLREATFGTPVSAPLPRNPYAGDQSDSDETPQPTMRTARTTRNPRTVIEPESDEEDEEDEDEDEDAEDEEMEDVEGQLLADEDDEGGDESEEDEEDMEGGQDVHPPPPLFKQERSDRNGRPSVTVTAPPKGPVKSVEAKEMENDDNDDDDDDELSDLGSVMDEEDQGEQGEEEDSLGDEEEDGSRSATPDLSKLTRRQRGFYEEPDANLMALSNEALKKKHLTAEEHDTRRAEMARRRKNLSEKRNEEEKMDTINKLLKKPAPKRRTRAEIMADSLATPGAEEGEEERPDPLFVRWVNDRNGSRIGVPQEWLEARLGAVFARSGSKMIEEVS